MKKSYFPYPILWMLVVFFTGFLTTRAGSQCVFDFETGTNEGCVAGTDEHTCGVTAVTVTKQDQGVCHGVYSIEVSFNIGKETGKCASGEIVIDCTARFGKPLNLDGKVISACFTFTDPPFPPHVPAPYGIQFFAKSVQVDSTGKEHWHSFYGCWNSILVGENERLQLEQRIAIDEECEEGSIFVSDKKSLDLKNIRFIGIKFAMGDETPADKPFAGEVFVDCITWER